MTDRKDILNELNTISPVVAGIPFVNVFVVPQGYFNRLAESILLIQLKPKILFTRFLKKYRKGILKTFPAT